VFAIFFTQNVVIDADTIFSAGRSNNNGVRVPTRRFDRRARRRTRSEHVLEPIAVVGDFNVRLETGLWFTGSAGSMARASEPDKPNADGPVRLDNQKWYALVAFRIVNPCRVLPGVDGSNTRVPRSVSGPIATLPPSPHVKQIFYLFLSRPAMKRL